MLADQVERWLGGTGVLALVTLAAGAYSTRQARHAESQDDVRLDRQQVLDAQGALLDRYTAMTTAQNARLDELERGRDEDHRRIAELAAEHRACTASLKATADRLAHAEARISELGG